MVKGICFLWRSLPRVKPPGPPPTMAIRGAVEACRVRVGEGWVRCGRMARRVLLIRDIVCDYDDDCNDESEIGVRG